MQKSKEILSVRDLNISFRGDDSWKSVVRNVSFDVAAGETVAIVGESGSGKSVTALSIMRLLDEKQTRVEGEARFSGHNLLAVPEAHMQALRGNEIGMIFQEPMTSLNPVLTVGRQLSEVLVRHQGLSHATAGKEAVHLLEKVRIPAASTRVQQYPHNFSGGMRQRVMIAMALACRPRLLIADEPTTALDVTVQAQILDLIKTLQAENEMGVLFITHDMGVVAEIADRTVVMLRGDLVETGETKQVLLNPRHLYTRALLAAVPQLGEMERHDNPVRFPPVDPQTGAAGRAIEEPSTVKADVTPVLEVRNLTTRFQVRSGLLGKVTGRVHAVENVSFSVQPGETLSLVGESGCGKSTIGRTLMRLIHAESGDILLDGKSISGSSAADLYQARRNMQMIFQDPFASLNPRIRIGNSIMEPMLVNRTKNRDEARRKTEELLGLVGLDPSVFDRYPHEFSGGQRQRICIARALALEPRLVVADESVSALDVSIKAQIVNLMMDIQERIGLSYLFISHDMAIVERVSHRVAVMYLGEIVEIGPRADIFRNPQHPYTKRLISAVPVIDPDRRNVMRGVTASELRTPIRKVGYVPPIRNYLHVSEGHFVQELDPNWT